MVRPDRGDLGRLTIGDPDIAAIRFGLGLGPLAEWDVQPEDMLLRLVGPDEAAARWPIPRFADAKPSLAEQFQLTLDMNAARDAGDEDRQAEIKARRQTYAEDISSLYWESFRNTLARATLSRDGFRERLVEFWANHFTVRSENSRTRHLVTPFVEEAIRSRLTGRFADMLWAVTIHPMMLLYLDQVSSIGPNSRVGRGSGRGLNENLARELLELHTIGPDGPYDQTDVRELAELLTGLSFRADRGFYFEQLRVEPGAETVLGEDYPATADLENILSVIMDLAHHPATARNVSRKLAGYFVSDTPPQDLVDAMAKRFKETGGDLLAVYEVMLGHPQAWEAPRQKVKTPFGFVASALRGLGLEEGFFEAVPRSVLRTGFERQLSVMGQDWQRPVGPDGFGTLAHEWVTPQGMAGRINWAMTVPQRLVETLPDPRDFVVAALGRNVPETVRFAARAAETRPEGVGLVLASAAFQRR